MWASARHSSSKLGSALALHHICRCLPKNAKSRASESKTPSPARALCRAPPRLSKFLSPVCHSSKFGERPILPKALIINTLIFADFCNAFALHILRGKESPFERYPAHGGAFLLLLHAGVDPSGLEVFVAKVFPDYLRAGARAYLQAGEGVTGAMEGDVLGDACRSEPTPHGGLRQFILEVGKDKPFSAGLIVDEPQGLLADRVVDNLLGLLHAGGDVDASVHVVRLHLLPAQRLDVAFTQSSKTSEEEGPFECG